MKITFDASKGNLAESVGLSEERIQEIDDKEGVIIEELSKSGQPVNTAKLLEQYSEIATTMEEAFAIGYAVGMQIRQMRMQRKSPMEALMEVLGNSNTRL